MDEDTHNVTAAAMTFLSERRGKRVHPTTVRIGSMTGPHIGIPHDPNMDVGLQTDLVERVLDGLDPDQALVWLTRGGDLAPGDADFAWFSASRAAFARHGHPLSAFYVITPAGWLNLVSDKMGHHNRIA